MSARVDEGARAAAAWRRRRRRAEDGYVAVFFSIIMASGLFLMLAAIAVDTSSWYDEMERVQKAADAAALGGVPFMPQDLQSAVVRAKDVARRNGYADGVNGVTVTVTRGDLPSNLKVTISKTIKNSFASAYGFRTQRITRTSTADYQGPAPMGSPCNTFGNEPNSGGGGSSAQPVGTVQGTTPYTNCRRTPQFWATVEGPQTGKLQGDRYQTLGCEGYGVDGCTGLTNDEYDDFGYVFVVNVKPSAVNTDVTLQLYDPMFLNVGQRCEYLPDRDSFANDSNNTNPYVVNSDARNRYSRNGSTSRSFCPGDGFAGNAPQVVPTTSFALRQQVDSQNPVEAPLQMSTGGQSCIAQYGGAKVGSGVISADYFKSGSGLYLEPLGQNFHNWVDFCTFKPTRSGDYYLQVRTNVRAPADCTWSCRGNTDVVTLAEGNLDTGSGSNSFAIRARTAAGKERDVSVSGYNHMPIFVNSDNATVEFNLIRVLPGAAGNFVRFSYYDAGDAQAAGSVRVLLPTDAKSRTTSLPILIPFPGGCRSFGGSAGGSEASPTTLLDCNAPIQSAGNGTSQNNGRVQTIDIPVPTDYTCDYEEAGGCWYRVQVTFGSGTVNDVTTWDAQVVGDPVRLVR